MFQKEIYGQRLKALRKEAGETQAQLAAFLGIKPNQVVEMENARKTTTLEKLAMICRHYKVSEDYLLGLIDEPRELAEKEGTYENHR